jgi:MYXO-CTERM domain-containing protein
MVMVIRKRVGAMSSWLLVVRSMLRSETSRTIPMLSLRAAMILSVGTLLLPTSAVLADVLPIQADMDNSSSFLGDYTGTLDYTGAGTSGTLLVSLTNTTDLLNGGYLTAFIFNFVSSDPLASVILASSTDPDFSDAAGSSGAPFGDPFDAGAGLGGTFLGSGSPAQGLAIGQSATFTFNVTATDAGSLTASSFMSGPYQFNFLVRFRGFENGGSDKVPGQTVPGPGALALLALGGLIGSRRRNA